MLSKLLVRKILRELSNTSTEDKLRLLKMERSAIQRYEDSIPKAILLKVCAWGKLNLIIDISLILTYLPSISQIIVSLSSTNPWKKFHLKQRRDLHPSMVWIFQTSKSSSRILGALISSRELFGNYRLTPRLFGDFCTTQFMKVLFLMMETSRKFLKRNLVTVNLLIWSLWCKIKN